jgi:hypothetical protein
LTIRSWGSLAAATSPSPFKVRLSGYSMFDWPEHSQTSPTITSSAEAMLPPAALATSR